ncbi:hypothetical protein J7K97_02950 [Candidatus Aerophobetes bacterium]|nr:hypothetical protein [Candidatus Aerophobetes bacterium]
MKKNEGFIVVLSLVIATAVLLLLGVFWGSIVAERKNVERSYHAAQALHLAEAGVEKAINELNTNPTPSLSGEVDVSGIGESEYTVTLSGDTALVQATGYSPGMAVVSRVERSVEVTLIKGGGETTVFDMALFGGANTGTVITKTGSGKVDSYNSEGTGKPYPNGKGNNGHIGTNSKSTSPKAVKITGSGDIDGNIYIGAGGDPDEAIQITGSANVSGEKLALDEDRELPEVSPPSIPSSLPDRGSLHKTGSGNYYIHESGRYTKIQATGSGDLIFDNNADFIYVEGDMSITGSGDIIVDRDMTLYVGGDFKFTGSGKLITQDNYKLTMYVGGDIKGTGSGLWNASKNPLNLLIYGLDTCSQVKITGSADLYGAVYARNAEIWVTGSGDIYGSAIGDTVRITGSGDVHYDEALKDPNNLPGAPTYSGTSYVFQSWVEQ